MNHRYFSRLVGLAAAIVVASQVAIHHAPAGTIAYTLRSSESLSVLKNPSNSSIATLAAMQNTFKLMNDRNMPFFELKNSSASANITELRLAVGDSASTFDFASLIDASPGVTFAVTGGDTVPNGIKTDTLQLTFTGFSPGKTVRFRTDIDADVGNALDDYRRVLMDTAGTVGNRSVASVTFAETGLPDMTISASDWTSGLSAAAAAQVAARCVITTQSDNIAVFSLSQSGLQSPQPGGEGNETPPPPLPEPATNVLMALGGGLAMFFARRQRRRVAAIG